jgi:hypothetical protein
VRDGARRANIYRVSYPYATANSGPALRAALEPGAVSAGVQAALVADATAPLAGSVVLQATGWWVLSAPAPLGPSPTLPFSLCLSRCVPILSRTAAWALGAVGAVSAGVQAVLVADATAPLAGSVVLHAAGWWGAHPTAQPPNHPTTRCDTVTVNFDTEPTDSIVAKIATLPGVGGHRPQVRRLEG